MSHFEAHARAVKVAAMLRRIPAPERAADVSKIATYCAAMTPAQRRELARQSGVTAPSEATWELLVRTLWARGAAIESRVSP